MARWTSFFVAWAAVGCVDYTVELVSPHQKGRPEFEVERCIARDEPLHYNEITVTWEEGSEVVFYWRAKVDGVPESSPAHFTYGEAPPHFENREFRPLDRNRRYVVAVGGPGHMGGTLEIEVDAQGLVHED